jgi:hypothetical protein
MLEAGSWKLEAGSWKLEAGSWPLQPAGSPSFPAHPRDTDARVFRIAGNGFRE